MIPTAEFPAIPESAAKIASERRCAILVHSGRGFKWGGLPDLDLSSRFLPFCPSPKGPKIKKYSRLPSGIKNAPTCYRAPRWPDPEFPRKIPKKYPSGRNSGTPTKYPKNTEKIPKIRIFGILGVFFGIFGVFWGLILGVQNFGPGGIFFGIFRGNSGSGISGLCSRSGRSQLRDLNFQARRAAHLTPIFGGEFSRPGLKYSSKI